MEVVGDLSDPSGLGWYCFWTDTAEALCSMEGQVVQLWQALVRVLVLVGSLVSARVR